MKKQKIIKELLNIANSRLEETVQSAKSANSFKSSGDMKQEGKYDTRAIEAGYLADAQNLRVEELKQEIQLLESIQIQQISQKTPISIGSLVKLKFTEKIQTYFISSTAGGPLLSIDSTPVLIVSAFSPIGAKVIGLNQGDEFELKTPKANRHYKVISVE
jgi:transcription elongation GreA/GreB family factor